MPSSTAAFLFTSSWLLHAALGSPPGLDSEHAQDDLDCEVSLLQASVSLDGRALHEDAPLAPAASSGSTAPSTSALETSSSVDSVVKLNVASADDGPEERLARLMPIAWVHVPKTGTSFANTFFGHPGICPHMPEGVVPIPGGLFFTWMSEELDLGEMCPGGFSDTYRSVPGHDAMGDAYDANIGHGLIMLRQPEQRLISNFNMAVSEVYMTSPPSLLEYAEEMAGYAVKMLTRTGTWGEDGQIPLADQEAASQYHFCSYCDEPVTQAETDLAVHRLQEGFGFIGITDEWALSVCLFHAMFGGECHEHSLANNRPGAERTDDELYDTSELHGFVDVADGALYEVGLRIFHSNLETYGVTDESCAEMCGI